MLALMVLLTSTVIVTVKSLALWYLWQALEARGSGEVSEIEDGRDICVHGIPVNVFL